MSARTLALVAVGMAAAGASAQQYSLVDLGTLEGPTRAEAVNRSGVAAGATIAPIAAGSPFRAFRAGGSFEALLPLPGLVDSHAFAIDDDGMIYGTSFTIGTLTEEAFLAGPDNVPVSLGAFAARGANTSGDVVGSRLDTAADGIRFRRACHYHAGVLTDLPGLGGETSLAFAITPGGSIVGSAALAGDRVTHAVLWRNGVIHDLGTLGGPRSQALAANDSGRIVGVSATSGGEMHAVLFIVDPAGTVTQRVDLGTLGDHASTALGINRDGAIVGTSNDRAFLFEGGALTDLNGQIDDSEWILIGATSINDRGQIVGWGKHRGFPAAFLLSPHCPADLTGASDPNDPAYGVPDGMLDASDFFYYLDQFVLGNLSISDLTGSSDPNDPSYGVPDGDADGDDFFYFLDLFVSGCA